MMDVERFFYEVRCQISDVVESGEDFNSTMFLLMPDNSWSILTIPHSDVESVSLTIQKMRLQFPVIAFVVEMLRADGVASQRERVEDDSKKFVLLLGFNGLSIEAYQAEIEQSGNWQMLGAWEKLKKGTYGGAFVEGPPEWN
jgi:hypothetical protein